MEKKQNKRQAAGIYQTMSNLLLQGTKLYSKEMHIPNVKLINGQLKLVQSPFMGPKTEVLKRLKSNDPYSKIENLNVANKASLKHDLEYGFAKSQEETNKADKRMIKNLIKHSSPFEPVELINNLVGIAGIGGKLLLQKLGLVDTKSFTDFGEFKNYSKKDKELLLNKVKELEKEGYGKDKKEIQQLIQLIKKQLKK